MCTGTRTLFRQTGEILLLLGLWINGCSLAYSQMRAVVRGVSLRAGSGSLFPSNEKDEWEEEARSMASKTLECILNSPNANSTAEKALKRTLRSVTARELSPNIRRRLRSRIKELVLGTSVFRHRHEYVWNITSVSENTCNKTRDMVDLHAEYLLGLSEGSSDSLPDGIPWPVDPVEKISVQHSMPRFLVKLWMRQYGLDGTHAICRASNEAGPVTLRRNKIMSSSDGELVQQLAQEGVQAKPLADVFLQESKDQFRWKPPAGCIRVVSRPSSKSIWSLSTWKEGCFELQDVGSQLIVAATEVASGEIVIDYCAGNGGKSLALAAELHLFDAPSRVIAHDVVSERLAQLNGSLDRAGLLNYSNVEVVTTSEASQGMLCDSSADVVLVDAPCSSCGVLRRRPSQRWMITEDEVCYTFPALQLSILQSAARLVKPGGRLVYATCSLSEWENQHVVDAWEASSLCTSSAFEPWHFGSAWPKGDAAHQRHCYQLQPHKHDSDGFFVARWRRSVETAAS